MHFSFDKKVVFTVLHTGFGVCVCVCVCVGAGGLCVYVFVLNNALGIPQHLGRPY